MTLVAPLLDSGDAWVRCASAAVIAELPRAGGEVFLMLLNYQQGVMGRMGRVDVCYLDS